MRTRIWNTSHSAGRTCIERETSLAQGRDGLHNFIVLLHKKPLFQIGGGEVLCKKRRSLLGAAVGKHCGEQQWFGKRIAVSVRYIGRKMKCIASIQEIAGVRELHFDGAGADGDRLFRTFEMRIRGGSTVRPDANAVGFKGARLL